MRLLDLEPQFSWCGDERTGDPDFCPASGNFGDECVRTFHKDVDTLAEANQIWFLCPACFQKNSGAVGTHQVMVGFDGRGLLPHQSSQSRNGGPSRWAVSGTGYADLTLSPSIDCGCWHGYVRNGEVTNA